MAERLNVNPTRMELRNLKRRLATAVKGHKMLKDKSDEMVRRFVELAKENKRLRREVEDELAGALRGFALARSCCEDYVIEEALAMPSKHIRVQADTENIMSVTVPKMDIKEEEEGETFPILCKGHGSAGRFHRHGNKTCGKTYPSGAGGKGVQYARHRNRKEPPPRERP